MDHAGLVLPVLRRQIERETPSELDGAFALALPTRAELVASLGAQERALLEALQGGLAPLETLCARRAQLGALQRLVSSGFVLLSKVTPSDAAHVARGYDAWNGEAARLALTLFARQRDPRGQPAFADGPTVARAILDRLVRLSGEAIIDVAAVEDGYAGTPLSRHPLVRRRLDRQPGTVTLSLDLGLPVIGVGASAASYYPAVGDLIATPVILPEHADVANACRCGGGACAHR